VRVDVRVIDGVARVEAEQWDRLLGPEDSPFNEHAFLLAAERASAVPEQGAQAMHLTVWEGEELVGALPLYLKADGRGEFIYDYHWYGFARRHGIRYYPKALAMSPYSPVAGPRLLLAPGYERRAALLALTEVAEALGREQGLTGVHLLFCAEDEADALEEQGWLRRLTYQPRWENADYEDFAEFLARFRHKDRVKIKRQRRRLEEHGLEVVRLAGEQIGERDWRAMHAFYQRTCLLYGTGSDYLKPATWESLFGGAWKERVVLFQAKRGDEVLGCSFCVEKGGSLYGRYWGSAADLDSLYFNLAFYEPIRAAIEEGWRYVYAGFGNSSTKYRRGLEPCPTHSVHRLFDEDLSRAIRAHLAEDRRETEAAIEAQRERTRLKPRE